jgi:uncharacterized protein Yka (UPF0111/DUF47 family)
LTQRDFAVFGAKTLAPSGVAFFCGFSREGQIMEITKKISLFRRTRALEGEIDEFLDKLSQCSLLFKIAIKVYLNEGCTDDFERKLQDVNKMESEADSLRRRIETQLYAQNPDPGIPR